MTLQKKLDAYKRGMQSKAPQDALDIMHHATESLKNSGIMAKSVKIGDQAPDFNLINTSGSETRLRSLISEKSLVLTFYRGRW